ncbi:MAG: T9SS type A sorting domain-containing protein [Flavobacteriales bacterium]|nr:T9SS type A sorting domain-containing protein [Flavobacteriales bacterium]
MRNSHLLVGVVTATLFCGGHARAQYTTAWISLFDGLSGFHSAEDITLLPSGDVAVSGVYSPGNVTEFHMAAFDPTGAPLWTNGLPDSIGRAWKTFQLNDGTLLALGDFENQTGTNDVLVHRYSTSGALLNEVVINSPGLNTGDDFADATMDADGHVYLTGRFSSGIQTRPGLARLDATGALDWWVPHPVPANWNGFGLGLAVEAIGDSIVVMWSRNGSSYSAAVGYSATGTHLWTTDLQITTMDNNNVMATDGLGHVFVGGNRNQQFNVTKLNADGAVAWSTDFAYPGLGSVTGQVRHVRCDAQGAVYSVGEGPYQASIPGPYLLLTKLSSGGNVLWMDTISGGHVDYCLNMDHALLHDDRWTIASAYVGSYLYEYDTSGTRLFFQTWNVPGAQTSKVNAMTLGADGALYLAGRAQLIGSAGDGFVAKLLPVSTGITAAPDPQLPLYPVPCSDRVQLPTQLPRTVSVTVSDIQGRPVFTAMCQGVVDVAGLPPGVYVLAVAGFEQRWRFVKE